MTNFLIINEFETIKVYELDNVTYNKIEMAFIRTLGERVGKKNLEKYLEKNLKDLTCQSYVDIMSFIKVL